MDQKKHEGQQQGQPGQGQQFERPNPNPNKDQAEGSRDNVRGNQNPTPGQPGGGTANRPSEREQDNPSRGQNKPEDRNV